MAIGPDRVQLLKQESSALGGDAADDLPYSVPIDPQEDALECAGVYLQDASNRDEAVYVARAGDDMVFRDKVQTTPVTLTDLLGAAVAHETIDSLVHALAETSYAEVTRTSGQVSAFTVWTDAGKTTKVRESLVTRSAGQASVVVENQYNAAGALVQTLTHTITRSAGRVASIATVET